MFHYVPLWVSPMPKLHHPQVITIFIRCHLHIQAIHGCTKNTSQVTMVGDVRWYSMIFKYPIPIYKPWFSIFFQYVPQPTYGIFMDFPSVSLKNQWLPSPAVFSIPKWQGESASTSPSVAKTCCRSSRTLISCRQRKQQDWEPDFFRENDGKLR